MAFSLGLFPNSFVKVLNVINVTIAITTIANRNFTIPITLFLLFIALVLLFRLFISKRLKLDMLYMWLFGQKLLFQKIA